MSTPTRAWLAFAAVGAGLIHLALVLDAPAAASVPLVIVGLAGFGWGVLVTFDERFLALRAALVGALVPLALWALVPLLGIPALPLLAATVLELFAAAVLARSLRIAPSTTAVSTGRLVASVLLGIVVIGAVTAAGLATTALGTGGGSLIDQHH